MITENLKEVHQNILNACKRSGRNPQDVTLVAVSKTKPIPMLEEAYAFGERVFGENKVQELCEKYDVLPKDIKWQMIGHLQRNKVKQVVGKVDLIHSVDSERLAEAINNESKKQGIVSNVLLEVNVACEESKFGFHLDEVKTFLKEASKFQNICIKGLMTIAPYTENPETNREYFRSLYNLYVDISKENTDNVDMSVLSMGMTGDYEVAIEEGATMVRVGTGIFGERNYN